MQLTNLHDKSERSSVIALGLFDCLHIGHLKLIGEAKSLASKFCCDSAVFTFTNNPDSLLGFGAKLVYVFAERLKRLKELDIDRVIFADFDERLICLTSGEFENLLLRHKPSALVCGEDYRYGHKGQGNIETLKTFCARNEINLKVVETLMNGGEKVSSTQIRQLLENGNISKVNSFLAESYRCGGIVEEGNKVGRSINFSTINIKWNKEKLLPKPGVYGGFCVADGKMYRVVANLGNRPTFDDDQIKLEAHLIGFNGNLYGREMEIRLDVYLRGIKRFNSPQELKEQIMKDVDAIGDYYKNRA